jgi:hypothetical protein
MPVTAAETVDPVVGRDAPKYRYSDVFCAQLPFQEWAATILGNEETQPY